MGVYLFSLTSATNLHFFLGVFLHFITGADTYWDLSFGNGDDEEPRDSSSAAIVACGFLEMSKYLPEEDAAFYTSAAKKLLKSLIRGYQVTDPAVSNGQLLHGVYAKSTPYNTCKNAGVDECVIWGDYYFMEALTRLLNPGWNVYW